MGAAVEAPSRGSCKGYLEFLELVHRILTLDRPYRTSPGFLKSLVWLDDKSYVPCCCYDAYFNGFQLLITLAASIFTDAMVPDS